jgi:hypothetical protein
VSSIGNIGNFLSPNLRTWADDNLAGTPGAAIIAALAVLGALMFIVMVEGATTCSST